MKASDFMIGDWISCGGRNFRINEIGGMFCLDTVDDLFAALEDVEPIPLTPEILERNGFLKTDDWFCLGEDYYDIDIIEISDGIWRVRYDNLEWSAITDTFHICYVHELQHALKLCGIDKEITL